MKPTQQFGGSHGPTVQSRQYFPIWAISKLKRQALVPHQIARQHRELCRCDLFPELRKLLAELVPPHKMTWTRGGSLFSSCRLSSFRVRESAHASGGDRPLPNQDDSPTGQRQKMFWGHSPRGKEPAQSATCAAAPKLGAACPRRRRPSSPSTRWRSDSTGPSSSPSCT